jgi:hypothetical protein
LTPVRDRIFQQEPYLAPKENYTLADRDGTVANYKKKNNIDEEEEFFAGVNDDRSLRGNTTRRAGTGVIGVHAAPYGANLTNNIGVSNQVGDKNQNKKQQQQQQKNSKNSVNSGNGRAQQQQVQAQKQSSTGSTKSKPSNGQQSGPKQKPTQVNQKRSTGGPAQKPAADSGKKKSTCTIL